MRLSPNFTLEELTRSASHPEIRNVPDMAQLRNLVLLCVRILQPLRDAIGRPVRITSGFRCPKLNKAVGGVPTSRHLTGQAADIAVGSDAEGKALFDLLRQNKWVDLCLWERSKANPRKRWIHVQWRERPRGRFVEEYWA